MAKYFISLGFLLGSATDILSAQELGPIQLDRPDQTECPFITPTKYIQVETGFTFEKIDHLQQVWTYPTSLIKYGISNKLELRLIAELCTEKSYSAKNAGITPLTIGFKTTLLEEKGWVPKTSFIGHITTSNVGSKKFHTTYMAPSFRFTMQHTVSNKLTVAYNAGAEWDGETPAPTYIYTFTTGISLSEKAGCYAEIYGFVPATDKPDHRCDFGITYLLNNDFMADISGGFGLSSNAPHHYISLGLSYRFKVMR